MPLANIGENAGIINSEHQLRNSIECHVGIDFVTKIGYFDMKICQQNAHIVSNLTKSIYSCKNVLYKGKRRQFLADFFSVDPSKKPVEDEIGINKLTRLDVANVRIIVFDSSEIEKEAKSKS